MSIPDFSAAVCPCDSSPQLGPKTPIYTGCLLLYLLPTADIHHVHSARDNFAFSSWVSSLAELPQPKVLLRGRNWPIPQPLPLPISGISMVAMLFPMVVSDPEKLSRLCSFEGIIYPLFPLYKSLAWECPWQKTPGQRRQLACWSCAMSPYGPGMVSDMTKYKGYSCLIVPNSAKGTLRPGCWCCAKCFELLSATPYWPKHHPPASKNQNATLGNCTNVLAWLGL